MKNLFFQSKNKRKKGNSYFIVLMIKRTPKIIMYGID